MTTSNPKKLLGGKGYGSIGHLSGSRLGPTDSTIHAGQERILTEKARDKHDRIIVTEKLDGSCVGVANIEGTIVAIGRAGFPAADSPHVHIRQFAEWLELHTWKWSHDLAPGERLMGEWCTMAHGTLYRPLPSPFVPFDLMVGKKRLPFDEMRTTAEGMGLIHAHVLHDGGPISVEAALDLLGHHGHHGAIDPAEGVVYRVERKGEFDFIGKFVRDTHVAGQYMPGMNGNPEDQAIWFAEIGEAA